MRETKEIWLLIDVDGHVIAAFEDKFEAELSEAESTAVGAELSIASCVLYQKQWKSAEQGAEPDTKGAPRLV